MRLLEVKEDGSFDITRDLPRELPPYAILSHTWGDEDEEVTYQDIRAHRGQHKSGYTKLEFCAKQAKKDGLQYIWADTCCIDKTNLVELSEAIVSMFRWYRQAEKCYAYMSDVSFGDLAESSPRYLWEPSFCASRWHSRGWTLQELLAPAIVEFYTSDEYYIGSKSSLEFLLCDVTDIPVSALRGKDLSTYTVEERLEWAVGRQTKKIEDEAYSLLGIFGIFMPLIYGEGSNAMLRLRSQLPVSPLTKTIISYLPYEPCEKFIGNETILRDLWTRIEAVTTSGASPCLIINVHGSAGQGKSELCYWLYRHTCYLYVWTGPCR
jgi:hypothetical protein